MGELLFIAFILIAIGCSTILLLYLISLLSYAIKRKEAFRKESRFYESIERLDEVVRKSVVATNQKLVSNLKKSGNFYQIDKEEAFYQTLSAVTDIVREEDLSVISSHIKDPAEWINSRIEYYVKLEKLNKTDSKSLLLPN